VRGDELCTWGWVTALTDGRVRLDQLTYEASLAVHSPVLADYPDLPPVVVGAPKSKAKKGEQRVKKGSNHANTGSTWYGNEWSNRNGGSWW
jgi:hypothetical protein